MHWVTPTFPERPRGEVGLRTVPKAYLTPVEQGRLHVLRHPDQWFTGAVHDHDGRLMRDSLRTGGLGGNRWAAADPRRVEVPPRRRRSRLRGRWLYGGTWFQHFGHFVVETLSTLWPDPAEVGAIDGLVFHRGPKRGPVPQPWQEQLIALAGYDGIPVRIVEGQGIRVDELLLPSRSVVYNGWAHPEVRQLWQRAAASPLVANASDGAATSPRVYLSRTLWHEGHRSSEVKKVRDDSDRDQALDALFASRGFDVVALETLPIADQVRRLTQAEVIAGPLGSALHMAMFAPTGAGVLELGDSRTPRVGLPMQRVIGTISGHRSAFAPRDWDLSRLGEELDELGLSTPGKGPVIR